MFGVLAVIGERCSDLFGFGWVLTVGEAPPLAEVEVDPAAAPPAMAAALVVPARAGAADTATVNVKLEQSATLSVRNRTSSTSFVGLRG
jgi:hypothetical protein